jgi:hypothetical protein
MFKRKRYIIHYIVGIMAKSLTNSICDVIFFATIDEPAASPVKMPLELFKKVFPKPCLGGR